MKKFFTFAMAACMGLSMLAAETVVLEENLNANEQGEYLVGWSAIDADGDGHGWQIVGEPGGTTQFGVDGDEAVASFSYDNPTYSALTPDNWLVSPMLDMPNEGTLTVYIAAQDASWYLENLAIYSTTQESMETEALMETVHYDQVLASASWTQLTFTLPAGTKYVAFRHYNVTDMFAVKLDNIKITMEETVEPVEPEDPHMAGYWAVFVDEDGNDVWYELHEGANGDYVTTLTLTYIPFGTFNPEMEEERPLVPCYFVIDGVRYGAETENQETVLGNANANLLTETEFCYTLPVGYQYSVGVCIFETTGEYGFYAAQGAMTGVDEINAGKTVANVRYFNMAGQEMTEANGLSIMVTTYTDGTSSAVKVIK